MNNSNFLVVVIHNWNFNNSICYVLCFLRYFARISNQCSGHFGGKKNQKTFANFLNIFSSPYLIMTFFENQAEARHRPVSNAIIPPSSEKRKNPRQKKSVKDEYIISAVPPWFAPIRRTPYQDTYYIPDNWRVSCVAEYSEPCSFDCALCGPFERQPPTRLSATRALCVCLSDVISASTVYDKTL